MRELRSADDRIDRTGGNAQCATYAGFFIDPGYSRHFVHAIARVKARGATAEKPGECSDERITTRCALVDIGRALDNCFGIRTAAGIAALSALRLWQQGIYPRNRRFRVLRQALCRVQQGQANDNGDGHHYHQTSQHLSFLPCR
jgi:hypothetical protein